MSLSLLKYELCDPGPRGIEECGTEYLTAQAATKRNDELRAAGETMRWLRVEESFEERSAA